MDSIPVHRMNVKEEEVGKKEEIEVYLDQGSRLIFNTLSGEIESLVESKSTPQPSMHTSLSLSLYSRIVVLFY